MNILEQASRFEEMPDFGMEAFGVSEDFDINAAFQEAIQGIASDSELALEEKVRSMGTIISEGTNEVYRDFVDFRAMAARLEMMCNHDHALNLSIQGNETLSGFRDSHKDDSGHSHSESSHSNKDHKDDDEYEVDPITGKKTKKKKRRGRFGFLMQA